MPITVHDLLYAMQRALEAKKDFDTAFFDWTEQVTGRLPWNEAGKEVIAKMKSAERDLDKVLEQYIANKAVKR